MGIWNGSNFSTVSSFLFPKDTHAHTPWSRWEFLKKNASDILMLLPGNLVIKPNITKKKVCNWKDLKCSFRGYPHFYVIFSCSFMPHGHADGELSFFITLFAQKYFDMYKDTLIKKMGNYGQELIPRNAIKENILKISYGSHDSPSFPSTFGQSCLFCRNSWFLLILVYPCPHFHTGFACLRVTVSCLLNHTYTWFSDDKLLSMIES